MLNVKFVHNSIIPKLLKVDAITLYPFVFIALAKEATPKWLVMHEMEHVRQVRMIGIFRFYSSYLLYYFAGRLAGFSDYDAYMDIPWEKQARDAQLIDENDYTKEIQT